MVAAPAKCEIMNPMDGRVHRGLAALAAVVVLLAFATAAQAAVTTFSVTGFGDGGGSCSPPNATTESCPTLRTAETAAETVSSASDVPTIQLRAGTYTLTGEPLTIEKPMTISGAGMTGAPSGTTIEQTSSGLGVLGVGIASGQLTLKDLELTGGSAMGQGGGILMLSGSLELDSALVTGNQVLGPTAVASGATGENSDGAGIYIASGTVALNNSAVTDNLAEGGAGGAVGASQTGGEGGLADGGGVFVALGGVFVATDSQIEGNRAIGGVGGSSTSAGATGGSGGLAGGGGLLSAGSATLTSTTVSGNTATGGTGGTAATDGMSSSAGGGGIVAENGSLSVRFSTVAANIAAGGAASGASGHAGYGDGGGIETIAPMTLVNSTLTGNQANAGSVSAGGSGGGSFAGGLEVAGSHSILASDTFAGNGSSGSGGNQTQGGNFDFISGSLTLVNTILVNGGATQPGYQNCELNTTTGFTDSGQNLEDDTSSQCGLSTPKDVLVPSGTAVVQGLASNGGPTQTMALAKSSPAIGQGGDCFDPSAPGTPALTVDQRGLPRAAPCDIGAFQHQLAAGGAASISGSPAVGHTLTCVPTAFTGDGLAYSYQWRSGSAAISRATASAYVVRAGDAGHSLSCEVDAAGFYGGMPSASSRAVTVPAVQITGLKQSHTTWREGSKLATISKARRVRSPIGTIFRFDLNEQATVTFTFTERVSGRKRGKRGSRTAGTLTLTGRAGANKVTFQGRLSRSKKLKPGRYTVTVTAPSAKPRSLTFTIAN
jgi:hypothetical protein